MQKCYTLYLGARNTDHHTITAEDYEKIEEVVKKTSEKYTMISAKGYWEGKSEETAIIVLALDNNERANRRIERLCEALLQEFQQFAIMCQISGTAFNFKEKHLKATNPVKTAEENSALTNWAKKMLERLPEQGIVKPLKRKGALSKLVKLKKENPQADFPEAQELLKEVFEKYADDLG